MAARAHRRGILGTARRLLRLWALHGKMDALWVTRDLKMALTWFASDAILNLATVTGTLLLAERFAGIGPWSKDQIVFMLGYGLTVSGILNSCFGSNILAISRRLGRGQFDHTLIQPQPVWMALVTEGFMPASYWVVLLPGIGLMVWAGTKVSLIITPGWLALLALNLASSAGIVVAFAFIWGSLAFWAPRSAEEISDEAARILLELRPFPLDGLGGVLTGGLLTVLPVGFVAWFPCRALLGLSPALPAGLVAPGAAVAFLALAAFVFRKGMKYYERTGSQRYSGWAHRG